MNLVTKVTDPNGNNYVYRYDDKGRLVFDSSAVTGATKYTYDAANNLTRETNANSDTIDYTYDPLNRLTERHYGDTQHVSYFYDGTEFTFGKGRLFKEGTQACTTKCQYDVRGRVIKEIRRGFICPILLAGDVNQSGSVTSADVIYLVNYVFMSGPAPLPCAASGDIQCNGTITQADITLLVSYVFMSGAPPCDVCPLIFAGTWSCDKGTDTTAYTYDRNDNLTSVNYPSGTLVNYDYDSTDNVIRVRSNRAGSVDTLAKSLSYVPFGPAESWVLRNNLTVRNHYDLRYFIDSLKADTPAVVKVAYTYDAVGNVSRIKNVIDTLRTGDFVYDDVYRLIEARSKDYSPDTLLKYQYADNGNRTSVLAYFGASIDTATYNYTNNRLVAITGAVSDSFSYDGTGNVTQETVGTDTTFQYNDAGRLTSINGGSIATYKYDGQHRRLRKIVGADTLSYIPFASGQALSEFKDNAWVSDFVYLNGRPLARLNASGGKLYFVNDHLGTPITLTDSAKTVRWTADWLPFGEIYDETASVTNNVRFPGQWRDTESRLNYNFNRFYLARIGRFVEADPVRLPMHGQDSYIYGRNNPMVYIDPDGLLSITITVYGSPYSGFIGTGGQLTLGFSDGLLFGDITYGGGVGAGFLFDPQGGPSVVAQPEGCEVPIENCAYFGARAYASARGALGAYRKNVGYEIRTGIGLRFMDDGGIAPLYDPATPLPQTNRGFHSGCGYGYWGPTYSQGLSSTSWGAAVGMGGPINAGFTYRVWGSQK